MYDIFLTGLESDLMDLTTARKCEEASAGDVRVTPVGEALDRSAVLLTLAMCFVAHTMLVFNRGERVRV